MLGRDFIIGINFVFDFDIDTFLATLKTQPSNLMFCSFNSVKIETDSECYVCGKIPQYGCDILIAMWAEVNLGSILYLIYSLKKLIWQIWAALYINKMIEMITHIHPCISWIESNTLRKERFTIFWFYRILIVAFVLLFQKAYCFAY